MREGERLQHASCVEQAGKLCSSIGAKIQQFEFRMCRREGVDDGFVLLGFTRAGGVDQTASCPDDRGRAVEQRQLGGGKRAEVPLVASPSNIGIAAQRAEA